MPRHQPEKSVLTLEPHQIILRPLVTEKGMHRSTRNNAYAFEVHRLATKADVRRAVEDLFEVTVLKVHTQTRKGKPRRTRHDEAARARERDEVPLRVQDHAVMRGRGRRTARRPHNARSPHEAGSGARLPARVALVERVPVR